MEDAATTKTIALLEDPSASKELGQDWAINATSAHAEAIALHASFTPQELLTVSLVAPRGNIITSGDTSSVATVKPPPMDVDVTPTLLKVARAPKGVRFVAAGLRRLAE